MRFDDSNQDSYDFFQILIFENLTKLALIEKKNI